jgi:hypothetical protein
LRGVVFVAWKQKVVRGCVGLALACMGPIAVAHDASHLRGEPMAQAGGEVSVAEWRCGRPLPPATPRGG